MVQSEVIEACFEIVAIVLGATEWNIEIEAMICKTVLKMTSCMDPQWIALCEILKSNEFHPQYSFVKVPKLKKFKRDLQDKFVKKYYETKLKEAKAKKVKALTAGNLHQLNERNEQVEFGQKQRRLFGCSHCKVHFWDTVREKKPFAQCRKCKDFYKAIDKQFEFGRGRFKCDCGNEWTSPFCMWHLSQQCASCKKQCLPCKIGPALSVPGHRVTNRKHHCEACQGKGECPVMDVKNTIWSKEHYEHTGSTNYSVTTIGTTVSEQQERVAMQQEKVDRRRYHNPNNLANRAKPK